MGQTQVDPRTGEILHGVARIDSHRRRTTARIWENLKPPAVGACRAADGPDLSAILDVGADEESLVLQRLRYLAAHEVGHTLGLMHNWAATTFGWGSVMDYLAPHIELKNGAFDLSDAYPGDIGSYDRLMIRWGYTPTEDPATLEGIVREGYARGNVYPLESDPRWAEYDWGSDPVAWLKTTLSVRRALLERFGPGQLRPGEPLYDLQGRFSLAYLYHRFAIQAAAQYVGGQFQTNALAGDGQTPVQWVPAETQRRALDALLEALSPENLDVPDRVLSSLVGAPSGTAPTRERFPSEAGDSVSPWTLARSLAGLIVGPLFDPERAARVSLASGAGALTWDGLLTRLEGVSWGAAPDPAPRRAALQRVAQRVVLDGLMELAARPEAAPEVRAGALAHLERLLRDLKARVSTDPLTAAHVRLAARDLGEFLERPGTRGKGRAPVGAPPGRPIGQGSAPPF